MSNLMPQDALDALFPLTVERGAYRLAPPTLLHLAALDRLGCRLGADNTIDREYGAVAGYVLGLGYGELAGLMTLPPEQGRAAACAWAARQPARDWPDLRACVAAAINAAFEAAVPGDPSDPTPGLGPTSGGYSNSPRP